MQDQPILILSVAYDRVPHQLYSTLSLSFVNRPISSMFVSTATGLKSTMSSVLQFRKAAQWIGESPEPVSRCRARKCSFSTPLIPLIVQIDEGDKLVPPPRFITDPSYISLLGWHLRLFFWFQTLELLYFCVSKDCLSTFLTEQHWAPLWVLQVLLCSTTSVLAPHSSIAPPKPE